MPLAENITLEKDIDELIGLMLSTVLIQVNGGDHFEVFNGAPDECTPTRKPILYFESEDYGASEMHGSCETLTTMVYRMGVKIDCDNKAHREIKNQGSVIAAIFNEHNYNRVPYSFTYLGTPYVDASFETFGLIDAMILGSSNFRLNDCKCNTKQFRVQLKVRFPHFVEF